MFNFLKKLSKLLLVIPILFLSVSFILSRDSAAATGLVAEWKFDENTGTIAADSSGNGNNGIINGAAWTAGKSSLALSFDGVNDYVNMGSGAGFNFLNSTQAITVEAWVYPTNYTGHTSDQWYIVSKSNYPSKGWWFHLRNGGKVAFITCDGTCHSAISSAIIPLNQWSHIVGWSNGATNKVYINSVEKALASSGTLIDATANLQVNINGADYSFNGSIDGVKIYSRALSASEIVDEYLGNTPVFSPTPTPQPTLSISSSDGLSLSLSSESKVASLSINNTYLPLLANTNGGFSLKEISNNNTITNLTGTLTQNPDQSLTQRTQANDIDFTFTYTPKDKYIEVSGTIQNLRTDDRALQLIYSLPLNAFGWNKVDCFVKTMKLDI